MVTGRRSETVASQFDGDGTERGEETDRCLSLSSPSVEAATQQRPRPFTAAETGEITAADS